MPDAATCLQMWLLLLLGAALQRSSHGSTSSGDLHGLHQSFRTPRADADKHLPCMQIMAARPADVSSEAWLLAIALSSLVPAAIYVGMTWRVLHKMKNSTRESDQAVAVVAALSVKNAATIEKFMMLLDGLDTHPSIGEVPK